MSKNNFKKRTCEEWQMKKTRAQNSMHMFHISFQSNWDRYFHSVSFYPRCNNKANVKTVKTQACTGKILIIVFKSPNFCHFVFSLALFCFSYKLGNTRNIFLDTVLCITCNFWHKCFAYALWQVTVTLLAYSFQALLYEDVCALRSSFPI